MGTNYYWRDRPCEHCGRHDEIHVGKSSAGWSLVFRAWPHRLDDPEHPEWGHDPSSPFGLPVVSRADWRTVFTLRSGELWDEYGRKVDYPLAWLDALKPPTGEQRGREDGNRGPMARPDPEREWRDSEGFRFYAGEFS